eukprot:TCALIF_07796-PA protein Name:"Similar to Proteolipid protein DM beta (Squalus acanthias)" AED:0.13 eAED:0.13 QI:210/0.5/1/1/1/1/3/184/206
MGSGQKSMSSSYEDEDCCSKCITRIPYATLIALILNWVGVGVFCTTLYRGVNLTLRLTQDVFQLDKGLGWIEPTQLTFIILAASMAALALMILVVAILATGATRHHVYRSDVGRAGGRIGTQREHMEVKGPKEIKAFCKDYVERAEVMFIMATLSCVLVILSLVHFLMALSANYAHIRGHDKFTELQEMHDLQSETMTLTERVLYK